MPISAVSSLLRPPGSMGKKKNTRHSQQPALPTRLTLFWHKKGVKYCKMVFGNLLTVCEGQKPGNMCDFACYFNVGCSHVEIVEDANARLERQARTRSKTCASNGINGVPLNAHEHDGGHSARTSSAADIFSCQWRTWPRSLPTQNFRTAGMASENWRTWAKNLLLILKF